MRALRSKVAKMEQARRAESEAGRDDHRRMMHMLNGAMVAHQPGLDQVRPEHADPDRAEPPRWPGFAGLNPFRSGSFRRPRLTAGPFRVGD